MDFGRLNGCRQTSSDAVYVILSNLALTGPSSTSASSTIVGPPDDADDADDVDGATDDVGPPMAVILMRMENLASIAYMMPVHRREGQTSSGSGGARLED